MCFSLLRWFRRVAKLYPCTSPPQPEMSWTNWRTLRDLNFTLWFCWRFVSPGMWHRVVVVGGGGFPTFRYNIMLSSVTVVVSCKTSWTRKTLMKALDAVETSVNTNSLTLSHNSWTAEWIFVELDVREFMYRGVAGGGGGGLVVRPPRAAESKEWQIGRGNEYVF